MCTCFDKLIGEDGGDETKRHLLTGILCSGDRQLIDFAGERLVSNINLAVDCLAFATRSYFAATAIFGADDSNEALGVACLNLWRSIQQDASFILEQNFYKAMVFLKRSLNSRELYQVWACHSSEQRALFLSALEQHLPTNLFTDTRSLFTAGEYFGLSEIETRRSVILTVFRMCSSSGSTSLYVEPIEQAFALLQDVLVQHRTEAWPEVAIWASGDESYLKTDYTESESFTDYNVLYHLFPQSTPDNGQLDYSVERFRLTLTRFALAYSDTAMFWQHSRLASLLAMTVSRLAACSQRRKNSSVARKLLNAFRTISVDVVTEKAYPNPRCSLYLSPLDEENELANLESRTLITPHSPLTMAFLDDWAGVTPSYSDVKKTWMETCVSEAKVYMDVGLILAYKPPTALAGKHWVRDLGARLSKDDDRFRLLALAVAASKYTPSRANPLPPVSTLISSLEQLCVKHSIVRGWRSAYIISSVKDGSLSAALLLSKHLPTAASRASLVLSRLTDIIFKPLSSRKMKDELMEISCFLKREVSSEEMASYLDKVVSARFIELSLPTVVLLLKVVLAVLGKENDVKLDGLAITTHVSLLKPVPPIDASLYQSVVKAVASSSSSSSRDAQLLDSIKPQLTSRQAVESIVAFIERLETCLGVQLPYVSAAVLYRSYATQLLYYSSTANMDACVDCFPVILAVGGVKDLFQWVKCDLFGDKSYVIDLWERILVLESAISCANK